MKKALALTLALVMVLALCACGGSPAPAAPSAPAESTTAPAAPETPAVEPTDASAELSDWSYTFEWSDGGTKGGVGWVAANRFADALTENTNGQLQFNLHWESELMGPPPEIEAVKSGEIDIAGVHHAFAGSASPLIEFCTGVGARGVFDSVEHYWRFIDTPEVRQIIEDEMANVFNVKLLWMNPASNSVVASSKPIHTMEDFKDLQIRTPGTSSGTAYGLLGATPVSMSASEIYMALERGVIDAADTGSDEVYTKAFYEVTPYIIKDYTCYPPHALFSMNLDLWNSIPADIQDLILSEAADAEAFCREEMKRQDADYLEKLEPLVEEIYLFPEEEIAKEAAVLGPNTKDTLFANVDSAVAETIWSFVESTR